MRIIHEPDKHRFIAEGEAGEVMGEIRYSPHPGILSVTHTVVKEAFQGRGLAKQLLDALAAHARANSLKVIPVCSYAVAAFAKHPDEYGDIQAK